MLDKSLPYYDIIMKATYSSATTHKIIDLPKGYHYKFYEDGDELHWAKIETSVDEFENLDAALAYFHRVFAPHKDILSKRMCFILNAKNEYVATATAWYKEDETSHFPLLHWVSVLPSVQGLGLGKAIVVYALHQFLNVETSKTIYLHTQTWSAAAVALYAKLGFHITYDSFFMQTTDKEAKTILETVLKKEILAILFIDNKIE